MATLKLISLHCIRRHDLTGVDEPEVYVDGGIAWSGVMAKGETEPLDGGRTDPHHFQTRIKVHLQESSNGADSVIGQSHYVTVTPTNRGLATFKTSGTHYELAYKVVA